MKWGTPGEYFDAVVATNVKLPTYKGDFLPYMTIRGGDSQHYWTGFYSTRPELKREIYGTANYLRAAEISSALVLDSRFESNSSIITYHHDGVTGTCRSQVSSDYHNRLASDKQEAIDTISKAVEEQLKSGTFDLLSGKEYRSIVLHNPLNWPREELLSISSANPNVEILDARGEPVITQSYFDPGSEKYLIYFYANQPAMSYSVYFILQRSEHCDSCPVPSTKVEDNMISNQYYDIQIDTKTGYIISATDKSGKTIQLNQKLMSYPGNKSGAYIFIPVNHAKEVDDLQLVNLEVYKGPLFSAAYVRWERKITQRGQKYYTQLILLPSKTKGFYWNIDLYVGTNEEIASRFELNENLPEDWFYTYNTVDVRKRSYVKEDSSARIATNQYPILGGLLINSSLEMMIVPKFPVGAGMLSKNSFEFILHRNSAQDDSCGLVEVLKDETTAHYSFFISLGAVDNYKLTRSYHEHRYSTLMFTVSSINPITLSLSSWENGLLQSGNFNYKTISTLGIHHEGVFIETILKKSKGKTIYIKNLAKSEQMISLPGFRLGKKLLLNGLSEYISIRQYEIKGELVGKHRPGTGALVNLKDNYTNTQPLGSYKLLGNEITCISFDIDEHALRTAKEIYLYTFNGSGVSIIDQTLANAQKVDDLLNQIKQHEASEISHSDNPSSDYIPNKDPQQIAKEDTLDLEADTPKFQEIEKFLGEFPEVEEEPEAFPSQKTFATDQDIEILLYSVILTLSCISVLTICVYLRSRKRKD